MAEPPWTDRIVGARMTVDQSFTDRVMESRFSNQEWSLIMTATSFEIEHPADPERARIVADTSQVEHVVPEFETIRAAQQMGMASGERRRDNDGVLGAIKSALGVGDDDTTQEIEAADRLAQEYARALQDHLESTGRWEEIRELAAAEE